MPKTLLLADDSVTIQKVVGISFANEDVRLITVDNGDAAIARARQERPDVILADVVMPGKSGYEVCEAVKADPSLRHIPVLLLTGTFEAFDEARDAAGAAGHVAKPFESQLLVEQVKRLLAQSEQPRSAAPRQAPPPAPAAPARPTAAPAAPSPAEDSRFRNEVADRRRGRPRKRRRLRAENGSAFAFSDSESRAAGAGRARCPRRPRRLARRTVAILPDQTGSHPRSRRSLRRLAVGGMRGGFAPRRPRPPMPSNSSSTPAPPAAALRSLRRASPGRRCSIERPRPHVSAGLRSPWGRRRSVPARRPGCAATIPPRGPRRRFQRRLPEDSFAGCAGAGGAELRRSRRRLDESSLDVLAPPRSPAPPRPAAAAERRPEPSQAVGSALEALTPKLRAQLHDTLEKIAWASFSAVTEQIVRQALERVEAIAWEVIPQMAETCARKSAA
jgi:CheY-like chemotaxis protein